MEHWYAFHTKPHKEKQVAAQLRQRRHDVFLPVAEFYPARAQAARERPYFPGYLFARIDLDVAGPGAVHWLPGLRQLVHFGGQPASLPDHYIVELRRHLVRIQEAGGLRMEGIERGAVVRIISGPFEGYEALFDARLDGAERVRVLLAWVSSSHQSRPAGDRSRLIPIDLNVGSIEKVRPRP